MPFTVRRKKALSLRQQAALVVITPSHTHSGHFDTNQDRSARLAFPCRESFPAVLTVQTCMQWCIRKY